MGVVMLLHLDMATESRGEPNESPTKRILWSPMLHVDDGGPDVMVFDVMGSEFEVLEPGTVYLTAVRPDGLDSEYCGVRRSECCLNQFCGAR